MLDEEVVPDVLSSHPRAVLPYPLMRERIGVGIEEQHAGDGTILDPNANRLGLDVSVPRGLFARFGDSGPDGHVASEHRLKFGGNRRELRSDRRIGDFCVRVAGGEACLPFDGGGCRGGEAERVLDAREPRCGVAVGVRPCGLNRVEGPYEDSGRGACVRGERRDAVDRTSRQGRRAVCERVLEKKRAVIAAGVGARERRGARRRIPRRCRECPSGRWRALRRRGARRACRRGLGQRRVHRGGARADRFRRRGARR
jgi:hypothetical protein